MIKPDTIKQLESLKTSDTGRLAVELIEQMQGDLKLKQVKIDALTFELARLKNWKFGRSSESLDGDKQKVLFDQIIADTALEDLAAREQAAAAASAQVPVTKPAPRRPVRQALPSGLPRIEHRHEPESTVCGCGQPLQRIGEEISEQLDCVPTQFFVNRHIRGKYACACCQTLQAEPMPAQMIDKGIPAAGLLAHVVVAKHDDHLPLYRLEEICARSGVHIARSSMAQWVGICGLRLQPLVDALHQYILSQEVVHADETPVRLLAPGKGKTDQAYLWAYRTTNFIAQRAVLFDFCTSRAGEHPRRVLKGFDGTVLCDDYIGYKGLFAQGLVTEAGCMAHCRRKLFEAHHLNGSQIAGQAVALIAKLYVIEDEAKDMTPEARQQLRQQRAKPITEELHTWLTGQRERLAKADATAKAIDHTLGRWRALMRYLDDGNVPIDNNAVENAIRPFVLGRKNWLFVGSEEAGKRAAAILSLIESAKLNGHNAWAYMKDVFERLPTLKDRDLHTLLPHNWRPATSPVAPGVAVSITSAAPAVPVAAAQPACADAVSA
jgi:transposase